MTDKERKELQALREKTWHLDGNDVFTQEEQKRFFELLLKEDEVA